MPVMMKFFSMLENNYSWSVNFISLDS
jgi:hypothetical protein